MGRITRIRGMGPVAPVMEMVQDVTVGAWVLTEIKEFSEPTVCVFNGTPLLRRDWGSTVIGQDDLCAFITLPQGGGGGGGGSNPIQAVIMVATIALAAYAAPYLASMMAEGIMAAVGGSFVVSAGTMSFLTAVAGGLIIGATGMLVNAVLPSSRTPSSLTSSQAVGTASAPEAASPTYSLQAQSNTARLLQTIPEGFGRNRHYPDLASQAYWEFSGNDQYLYQIFCLGQGEYEIEVALIADTEVWRNGSYTGNFEDITFEFVGPGGEVTLCPDNVVTSDEVSGTELDASWAGPFVASAAGTEANYLAVDFVMQRGLYHWNDQNELEDFSVGYEVQARRIDDDRDPLGSWITLESGTITRATNTAQRVSCRYAVAPGRYEVQCRRTTEKSTSTRDGNDFAWATLRAYLPSKRTYGNVTTIATRAKATNALSNVSARKFNFIATRKLPAWNPGTGTWSAPRPTTSLAWALAAACRQKWGGNMVDSRVDLDQLARLDAVWVERGDECNAVIDSADTIWGVLTSLARAGRAKPIMVAGNVTFLRDEPQTLIKGVFTPEVIVRGSFSVDYVLNNEDAPDDVIVEYFDTKVWKWKEAQGTLEGSNSTNPARVKILGIGSYSHAWREAIYEAACNARRRVFVSLTTEMDGRLLIPGHLVSVSHPLPKWGYPGELRAAVLEEGKPLWMRLSNPVDWEDSRDHYIGLRRPNGTLWGPCLAKPGDSPRHVYLDDDDLERIIDQTGDDPRKWINTGRKKMRTCYQFGPGTQWARKCIVVAVTPRGLDRVDVLCVNESAAVHTADQGSVPPEPPSSLLPGVTDGPIVTGLRATQSGTADAPILNLGWTPAAGSGSYIVQTSSNNRDWTSTTVTECAASLSVPVGMTYARVAGMGTVRGPWATWSGMVGGEAVPPAPVSEVTLAQAAAGGDALIHWPQSLLATAYVVQIWRAGTKKREVVQAGLQYSYSRATAGQDGGPWRSFEARVIARNSYGDSAATTLAVSDPAPAVPANIVATKTANSVTLTWDTGSGDVTGHLAGRGATADFAPAQAVETKTVTGGTVTFTGLTPNTDHFFRIAAKDLFYDRYPAIADLNVSDVITVRTNP